MSNFALGTEFPVIVLGTTSISLLDADGRVLGILRGTPFTPKQEDVTSLLTDRVHGIDALLHSIEPRVNYTWITGKSQTSRSSQIPVSNTQFRPCRECVSV